MNPNGIPGESRTLSERRDVGISIVGSEQESEEVPDWRGLRDFALSGEFDGSSVRSADAGFAERIAETGWEPYFQRSRVRLRSHGIP